MPNTNSGSIALTIFNSISPMPAGISGNLITFVNNRVFYVENYTGDTVGTTSIAEKYQPAITDLSTADAIRFMSLQDMGVNSVSIGDLSTENSNLMEMSKQFEERGNMEMKSLAKGIKMYKARG